MKKPGILAAAIAIAVAAVWLCIRSDLEERGPESQNPVNRGFTVVKPEKPVQVLIEAEASSEISLPAQVRIGAQGILAQASGGRCCYIGPEKWNDKWREGQVEGVFPKGHEEASYPGFARYRFRVPQSGEYTLWLRAWWVDDCGNSVEVSLQGGRPQAITGSTFGKWIWERLRDVENQPISIRLEEGREYSMTICNREDDVYFDQILLLDAKAMVDPAGIHE